MLAAEEELDTDSASVDEVIGKFFDAENGPFGVAGEGGVVAATTDGTRGSSVS